MPQLTGAVLCGGASRRMGRDKAALTLSGQSFLALQADKLRAAGADELLLSGPHTLPGARAVPDLLPGRGPLGGLHACLKAARHPHVLVLGVDLPRVSVSALRALLDAYHANRADAAVCLSPDGRPEPLIAVYRAALWRDVQALITDGPAPVRALLDAVDAIRLPYPGPASQLLNCNTPEDYRRLLSEDA